MALNAHLLPLSAEDYLEGELHSEIRHEYVAGRVFAMTGTSRAHNLIALNIATALHAHLRGGPCRVFMSDLKVRVEKADAFYYPDIAVTCHPADTQPYYLTHPRLIVEVLSPSTEGIDRREKLLAYQSLDSLDEYVLVAQDTVQVEVYRRDGTGGWWLYTCGEGEELRLDAVDLVLPVAAIYQDVPF
ncbi:MAG: Uma2 family endonuclease [Gammaproteobacteria bacterium]|nr:Uma2 family endonuclease [Gammaproteobacteria bacterium]